MIPDLHFTLFIKLVYRMFSVCQAVGVGQVFANVEASRSDNPLSSFVVDTGEGNRSVTVFELNFSCRKHQYVVSHFDIFHRG